MENFIAIIRLVSIVFLTTFVGISNCNARIEKESTKPLLIPIDYVSHKAGQVDIARVIPANAFVPGSSQAVVMNKMADLTMSYFVNSAMKDSPVLRAANQAKDKLKTDFVVPSIDGQGPNHKFTFKFEAFQSLAKMEYKGWLNAAFNYDLRASGSVVTLQDNLFSNKILSLKHESNKIQNLSMIGLAWTW